MKMVTGNQLAFPSHPTLSNSRRLRGRFFTVPLLALAVAGLSFVTSLQAQDAEMNTLSATEKAAGWKLLFDGKTLAGWRSYYPKSPKHWVVEDGCLKNPKGTGRPDTGGGQIISTEAFDDFDFRFEWKIAPGGNSGMMYFVKERLNAPGPKLYKEENGHGPIGHEYQLLDDKLHPDGKLASHRAGALYALIAPNASKHLKPTGEFNQSRIVVQGKHVEHWLNGAKIVEYELESPELMAAIDKSKYKDQPGFGTKFKAPFQIQDHGDEIWFRNLKVRPLAATP
jgi:hypothetical protein